MKKNTKLHEIHFYTNITFLIVRYLCDNEGQKDNLWVPLSNFEYFFIWYNGNKNIHLKYYLE